MTVRAAIAGFALSILLNLVAADWSWNLWLLPALLFGWFLADLASGGVHMLMDYLPCPAGVGLDQLYHYEGARDSTEYERLRDEVMARISPIDRLLFDFKVHHPRPTALGRRSLYHQIWSSILFMALPLSLAMNVVAIIWDVPGWAMLMAVTFLLGGAFSQYFHGTLHREDNPPSIHALRHVGLLMTPEAHDVHHESLQRDFSTVNGWSNPLLNLVFRWLRAKGRLPDHGLEPS